MYGHVDDCGCTMCVGARAQGLHQLGDPPAAPAQEDHAWRPGGTPGNETAQCADCGEMPFTGAHMGGELMRMGFDTGRFRRTMVEASEDPMVAAVTAPVVELDDSLESDRALLRELNARIEKDQAAMREVASRIRQAPKS